MSQPINMFRTSVENLESLDDFSFSIPTYQRPYVWGDEQLKKLLKDFYSAYSRNPDLPYYLSTFLTKDNGQEYRNSELIDGQQRFTTLWLIAFSISNLSPGSSIENFLKKNGKLRLDFEIREEIYSFLMHLLQENETSQKQYNDHFIENHPYLKNIAKALKTIDGLLKDIVAESKTGKNEELKAFGDYIYRQVFFIKNTTPPNTDLNKLFSTTNNSGVQLEQTDIVKANLLKTVDDKVMYSKIWEACENMNSFFERNARLSFPQSDWKNINLTKQTEFDPVVFKYTDDNKEQYNGEHKGNINFSIERIDVGSISTYKIPEKEHQGESDRDSEEVYCRSIINFGQLLLHTYRLHLKIEKKSDFEGTFHVNRLIRIFKSLEESDSEEVMRFFKLLWKVRYLFDKYVVKWVSDTNTKDESLELVNMNRNAEGYYSRTPFEEKANSLMLQSVLYYTGDYVRQYWLSSYLDFLLYHNNNEEVRSASLLNYLENLDNVFSLNKSTTDKQLSWMMMHQTYDFPQDLDLNSYLSLHLSTGFKHYWFQKLEYILWKNWPFEKTVEFNNYRITSKNSIEHIYPQNPENLIQHPSIGSEFLHSFGNLVLLSVSQNSEYSNKSYSVKRSMFKEKRDSHDTLKSYYIFQNECWSKGEIENHKNLMIEKMREYYFDSEIKNNHD